ncbi:hypothetical protein CYMTET_14111, partial [Cymbomonas tetramitiformis]
MLIEFPRLEEAIVEDLLRDLEGPTNDLVEAAELARVKHDFGRHPARRVEPWESELLDDRFPACRQEQCGLEELPDSRKVRTKHLYAYIDLALRELAGMQRALAGVLGIEQPSFDEEWAAAAATSGKRRAVRQPSGSDGENSQSEEKRRAAAKARFGSLRTATDEELRQALDGSLAGVPAAATKRSRRFSHHCVKCESKDHVHYEGHECTAPADGEIVAEPEEEHAEDVTMAVGVDAGEELLEELAVAVERYQDGAYAESTQRSYDTGVKAFLTFCVEGRGKRGALVPMAHAALVAGLKSLAVQVGLDPARSQWRGMRARGACDLKAPQAMSCESELPEGDTFYAAMGKCGRSWRHLQWASVLRAYIHPPKQRGSSSSPAATDCSEHPDGKWEDHRARNTLELRQRHVYGCFDVRIEEPGAAGPMEVDAPGPAQDDVGTSRGSSVKANSSGLLIMADWVVSQISEMRPAVLHKAAALYHLLNEIDLPLGPEPPPVREACPLCGAGVRFQAWGHGTCEPCPAQAAASP